MFLKFGSDCKMANVLAKLQQQHQVEAHSSKSSLYKLNCELVFDVRIPVPLPEETFPQHPVKGVMQNTLGGKNPLSLSFFATLLHTVHKFSYYALLKLQALNAATKRPKRQIQNLHTRRNIISSRPQKKRQKYK